MAGSDNEHEEVEAEEAGQSEEVSGEHLSCIPFFFRFPDDMFIRLNPDEGLEGNRPELGHLARWAVSSHKYGYGPENLRDNDVTTFWQ